MDCFLGGMWRVLSGNLKKFCVGRIRFNILLVFKKKGLLRLLYRLQVCKADGYFGFTNCLVEVLNASNNSITSVSEISSLVELRALILNSESLTVYHALIAYVCQTRSCVI